MDETFDFVIVGSGGGSMCAALYMASVGKTPIILEKTDLFGGTTATSGGAMWIPNNRFMAKDGVKDSQAMALAYLEDVTGNDPNAPGATAERRVAYVREAPRMIDFLISQGIKLHSGGYWPDYYDDRPGGALGRQVLAQLFDANELGPWKDRLRPGFMPIAGRMDELTKVTNFKTTWAGKWAMFRIALRTAVAKVTGKKWLTAGAALQGRMLQAAVRASIDMRANAEVTRLLTDANGDVTGVAVNIDGKEVKIGARDGVLINAGGFSRNQAMRDQYQPGTRVEWTITSPGDTGEMIQEMMRIGAAVGQMEEMIGMPTTVLPTNPPVLSGLKLNLSAPHSIVVDQTGVRYMREAQSYMEIGQAILARNKTVPAVPSWMVVDSQYLRKYMLAGSMPGKRKPQSWYDSGFLRHGNSLAELADACGVDAGNLTRTVERFNGLVRKGRDEDFHRGGRAFDRWIGDPAQRPCETLGTIEQGPFYAIPVYPGDVSTFGGAVTDAHARVLREDGSIIGGLYATGVSTASFLGRHYVGGGASVGPSFTWGYVAAKHAVSAARTAPHASTLAPQASVVSNSRNPTVIAQTQ